MRPDNWATRFNPDHVRRFLEWFNGLDDAVKLHVAEVRGAPCRICTSICALHVIVARFRVRAATRPSSRAQYAVRVSTHLHTTRPSAARALIVKVVTSPT